MYTDHIEAVSCRTVSKLARLSIEQFSRPLSSAFYSQGIHFWTFHARSVADSLYELALGNIFQAIVDPCERSRVGHDIVFCFLNQCIVLLKKEKQLKSRF